MEGRKIYILVQVFQGIQEGVELFWEESAADTAFKEFTGHDYPKDQDERDEMHEDYRDTMIFVDTLPPKKGENLCGEKNGEYTCNEKNDHFGNHVHRGMVEMAISVWTRDHNKKGD